MAHVEMHTLHIDLGIYPHISSALIGELARWYS